MSKYIKVTNPQAAPNQCGGCGTTVIENGFVDTNLNFDFYGALYFCESCVAEMARLYGFIKPTEEYAKMLNVKDDMKLIRNNYKVFIEELENLVDKAKHL